MPWGHPLFVGEEIGVLRRRHLMEIDVEPIDPDRVLRLLVLKRIWSRSAHEKFALWNHYRGSISDRRWKGSLSLPQTIQLRMNGIAAGQTSAQRHQADHSYEERMASPPTCTSGGGEEGVTQTRHREQN
ncbi:hypothetical protein NSPZN2_10115 [Nitrospira defluvii]|uniref:Uncharacterized protein n=1 Tax=Nitrospira defluvii TaxID=330214 RepID=A0ABM8QBX3_9BACT|nr:hypothetical protein NSPZN2_10115 [Nitrospira defluvii]